MVLFNCLSVKNVIRVASVRCRFKVLDRNPDCPLEMLEGSIPYYADVASITTSTTLLRKVLDIPKYVDCGLENETSHSQSKIT